MSQDAPTNRPTAADAAAVASAAGEAAAASGSAAEAQENVQQAVDRTAADRGIQMTEADKRGIVDGLVAELERRGAWQDPTPPAPATPPATAAGQPTTPPPTASSDGGAAPSPNAPDADVPVPRKKTLAERFQGS